MCTFSSENGSNNYQCAVNKGLILPQYMLLLCPCPHSMVKEHQCSHTRAFVPSSAMWNAYARALRLEKKKGKKKEGKKEKKIELGFVQDSWHLVISGREVFDLGAWKEESGNVLDTVQCLQKPYENLLCSFSLFRDGQLPYCTKFFTSMVFRELLTIFVDWYKT